MKVMHPAKEVRRQGIWGCLNSRVTEKVLAGFDWVSPQLTWSTLRPCLRYSKDANWEGYQISSLQAHYGFLACFSIEEVWWRATQVHCLIRSKVICRITSNRRNFNLPIYGFKGLCKWLLIYTVVLRWNYQKKNVRKKISSESMKKLTIPSEKCWFSLFELALFEKFHLELYLMKSVNRNLRFAVFWVFPKNGPLRRLLGRCFFYNQSIFYTWATLCAIFMSLAPKMGRPQWLEVGWSAIVSAVLPCFFDNKCILAMKEGP